jgi:threonine/homoserine/homoserine lactone efflux protein
VNALGAIAGLLCVAALTPGPNNLVVLRTASRDGLRGALPAVAGVVLGGLALLCVTAVGAGTAFAAWPALRRWLAIAGAAYLVWLGVSLIADGLRANRPHADKDVALPAGTLGLVGFQFLNPKSWVMVLTAIASVPVDGLRGYLPLAGLFVAIPAVCLLLWAALGALLARSLTCPRIRRGADLGMGALLVASAGLLLLEP